MRSLARWRAQENGERIGRNLRWLSRLNWFLGDKAEAERYALEASSVLEALPPGKELAMAYSNIAQLRMLEDNAPAAVQWGTQAMELAARLGDDEIQAHALTNVGTARYATGDEEGRTQLEASVQIALAHNFEEHVARAYTNLASVSVMFRHYARALEYLDAGIRYTTERDLDSWRLYMTGWRARARFEQGDWASASQEAEQVLASYRVSPVVRISALITLAWVRLRRGDPGGEPLLREARELALKTGEPQRIVPVAAARAEMAWLQGDLAACKSEARAAYTLAVHHANPWDVGQMSYWLWKTGEQFDIPARLPEPYAQQLAGDWQAAAATWQRIGCPYEEALALANGDAPARQRALNLLGRLGARATMERLRQEQGAGRSPRVDHIPRGPRPSTQKNPAGLTNQQFEVLRMMVGGLSNSEIAAALQVSPKTVEHHVSAVLAKLVVRSRAQAVAHAHNLGVTPNMGEQTLPR